MTDFLFTTRRGAPGALRSVLNAYLGPVSAEVAEHAGPWGTLAVATPWPHLRPVVADERFVSALAGEPVVRAPGLAAGIVAPGPRRAAVHALLAAPGDTPWDEHLDGQFAGLGIDAATGSGIVVTDLMSFIPVFEATDAAGGLVIGTHADAVAAAAGRTDIDPVSAADLMATRCICYPHTLYHGVSQVHPGTARRFGPGGWTGDGHAYWLPAENRAFPSIAAASEALRAAVVDDVRIAVDGLDHVAMLLSAGEDSRAILGAVPRGVRVDSFIYADTENREVQVARRAAAAYGSTLTFGQRPRDHYLGPMETVVSMVGSHQLFLDVHGFGFHESLGLKNYPLVLGGYSSDSLLKAEHARKTVVRLRATPGIRPEILEQVRERHEAQVARVRALRPESGGEWYRLWPFSQRSTGSNVHGNRRLFHIHEPYHSSAIVKLAAGVPQEWKRSRKLFHPAVRPLLARSWYVPHARSRFPYFGPVSNVFLGAGLQVARNVGVRLGGVARVNQGPWPRWSDAHYAEPIARLEARHAVLSSPVASVFPDDRARAAEQLRGWGFVERFIAMQLAYLSARVRQVADEARGT